MQGRPCRRTPSINYVRRSSSRRGISCSLSGNKPAKSGRHAPRPDLGMESLETLGAISNPIQRLVAPQGLHRIRASVVSDHIEWRARSLQAVANPRAFIANLPALVIKPRAILNLASSRLRARIGHRLCDLVPQHNRYTILIPGGRWIHEVLPAAAAGVEHVRHVDEHDARGHAGIG